MVTISPHLFRLVEDLVEPFAFRRRSRIVGKLGATESSGDRVVSKINHTCFTSVSLPDVSEGAVNWARTDAGG